MRQKIWRKNGGIVTPAVLKKQMQSKQISPAEIAAPAILLAAEGSNNSQVLELLMDLASHMSVTNEYIAQRK